MEGPAAPPTTQRCPLTSPRPAGLQARHSAGLVLAFLIVLGLACPGGGSTGGDPAAGNPGHPSAATATSPGTDPEASAVQPAGSTVPPPPAGNPADSRIDLVAAAALGAEAETPLDPSGGTLELPSGDAALRLETLERLDDYRVRLADPKGRLLPALIESGPVPTRSAGTPIPGGTWIRVQPTEPLEAGKRYELRIEGERGPHVLASDGRRLDDLVLTVRVHAP